MGYKSHEEAVLVRVGKIAAEVHRVAATIDPNQGGEATPERIDAADFELRRAGVAILGTIAIELASLVDAVATAGRARRG